jgi:hypothetical protein
MKMEINGKREAILKVLEMVMVSLEEKRKIKRRSHI